jgi:hypothetical protein
VCRPRQQDRSWNESFHEYQSTGPGASVVIVVGRSEHGYHHLLGSVPQALERHAHYPVIVIA